MSINDHLLIDKYFHGGLRPEEKKLFEEKLATDTAFSEEVQIHQQALQHIDQEGHQMLKARLAEKGKAIDQSRRLRKWVVILMIALAGFLVLKLTGILQSSAPDGVEENLQPIGTPQIDPTPPVTDDTLKNLNIDRANNQPKDFKTAPIPEKATDQNTDELFAAYYTPFEDESLQSSLRGQDSPSPSDRFIEAYLKGNYTEALSLFEIMDEYDQKNDNMLFLKANILLASYQYKESISLLEQILDRNATRYIEETRWYLSLSYIKIGATERARTILLQLKNEEQNKYTKKTIAILKLL